MEAAGYDPEECTLKLPTRPQKPMIAEGRSMLNRYILSLHFICRIRKKIVIEVPSDKICLKVTSEKKHQVSGSV